jgi:hypothetical protein
MMCTNLFSLALFLVFISIAGCCNLVDCDENDGYISLRLMRNGVNAVYGPGAIVHQDSIMHFYLSGLQDEQYVDFIDTFQSIGISVSANNPSILEIGHIRTDTFSITTETIPANGICDCDEYHIISVLRNGQVICTGECEEVIDIEI